MTETPPPQTLDEKINEVITINEVVRFDRQQRIWGAEGQKKLQKGRVSIVSAGPLGEYIALSLVALGVGEVRVFSTPEATSPKFIGTVCPNGINDIAQKLNCINPTSRIPILPIEFCTKLPCSVLSDSHIIIDATNNPTSKAIVHQYAQDNHISSISASVSMTSAAYVARNQEDPADERHILYLFKEKLQDPIISLFWAGVIAEETKKLLLGEQIYLSPLNYTKGTRERFVANETEAQPINRQLLHQKRVLVVGAGAESNIAAIALAHSGVGSIVYMDNDTVESTNLNRQVLFDDCIGLPKATALASKHISMNPEVQATGQVKLFEIKNKHYTPDTEEEGFDLVFDLVDNVYARAVIAAYAVQRKIPLVSAGCSPDSAQAIVYVPGKTACPNHVFSGYYEKGLADEKERRKSCIREPDPSVIMTNMIGGSLAVLEGLRILELNQGEILNGILSYKSAGTPRLTQTILQDICDCHSYPERVPDMELP